MSVRNFNIMVPKQYGNVLVEHVITPSGHSVVKVQLYDTIVFAWNRDTHEIVLNSGGHRTATTKTALQTAISQVVDRNDYSWFRSVSVFQRLGNWFITYKSVLSQLNLDEMPFIDGIVLKKTVNGVTIL